MVKIQLLFYCVNKIDSPPEFRLFVIRDLTGWLTSARMIRFAKDGWMIKTGWMDEFPSGLDDKNKRDEFFSRMDE